MENSGSTDLLLMYSSTRARFLASNTSRTETLREISISIKMRSVSLRVSVEFSMALELKTLSESSDSSISLSKDALPLLN